MAVDQGYGKGDIFYQGGSLGANATISVDIPATSQNDGMEAIIEVMAVGQPADLILGGPQTNYTLETFTLGEIKKGLRIRVSKLTGLTLTNKSATATDYVMMGVVTREGAGGPGGMQS